MSETIKQTESDSRVRNIVREIVREAMNNGVQISEDFVKYYVRLLSLDPTWGIKDDMLNRNVINTFVLHCVDELEKPSSPTIVGMKMQMYFKYNFDVKDKFVMQERTDMNIKLKPLAKEIMETNSEEDEDMRKFIKKIIYYVTLSSGLGNPSVNSVYKDAESALNSIFTTCDIREFMEKSLEDKELELVQLTEIVSGIRLFNRDRHKGGPGIEDLPKLLTQATDSVKNDLQEGLVSIMDKVNMLTSAVDNSYDIRKEGNTFICEYDRKYFNKAHVEHATDLLIVYRQFELFARKILIEVQKVEENENETLAKLKTVLSDVNELVRVRAAIPVAEIYPLFTEVSFQWWNLQSHSVLIARFAKMLLNLNSYIKQLKQMDDALKLMVGATGPVTDAQRLEDATPLTIDSEDMEIMDIDDFENFEDVHLEYLGFCPFKMVETGGGLIPGNPNMGICVRGEDSYYVFSCPEAATAFADNPKKYLYGILDLARKKPTLIQFLHLYHQLVEVFHITDLIYKSPEITKTNDVGCETTLHITHSNIDPNYMWNVWDWKRQAILFANLSRRLTHSTRTNKSNYRNAAGAQTQELRDKNLQTMKENYTNVPTVSNFMYGLRGRKDDTQHIITLTRPVDE